MSSRRRIRFEDSPQPTKKDKDDGPFFIQWPRLPSKVNSLSQIFLDEAMKEAAAGVPREKRSHVGGRLDRVSSSGGHRRSRGRVLKKIAAYAKMYETFNDAAVARAYHERLAPFVDALTRRVRRSREPLYMAFNPRATDHNERFFLTNRSLVAERSVGDMIEYADGLADLNEALQPTRNSSAAQKKRAKESRQEDRDSGCVPPSTLDRDRCPGKSFPCYDPTTGDCRAYRGYRTHTMDGQVVMNPDALATRAHYPSLGEKDRSKAILAFVEKRAREGRPVGAEEMDRFLRRQRNNNTSRPKRSARRARKVANRRQATTGRGGFGNDAPTAAAVRDAGYRELQRMAKAMGVKANGTTDALRRRLLQALPTHY